MNASQVKASAETAKEVMNDPALKSKGDKERRLKEKKANNIKKFMDERKNLTIKQGREKEKLKMTHEKEIANLDNDIPAVSFFSSLSCLNILIIAIFCFFLQTIVQYTNEIAQLSISSKYEFYCWRNWSRFLVYTR